MASTSTSSGEAKLMDPTLYKAAAEGDIDAFKNINGEHLDLLLTPNKNTVLHIHITAQCGKMESTSEFVEKILDMRQSLLLQANTKGETPLHMAARHGCSRIVEVLIERAKALHEDDLETGVETARHMMRMTNKENDTALHEAVRLNHLSVVQLLTKEDPDFSYSGNKAGETPLYLAAAGGFCELVSEILNTCEFPAHGGPNARTALHAAVIVNDKGMTENILKWKEALSKEGDQEGWTPLHYAARLGHVLMVKVLLSYDKSVAYSADKHGKMTALHIAAGLGHTDIVKELILRCPDCCELVDNSGRNVLHFALENRRVKVVQVLLENPSLCNLINERDVYGKIPLHQLATTPFYKPMLKQNPRVEKIASNKGFLAGELAPDHSAREEENYLDYHTFNEALKAKETHLIVATLIATVTFAAGFTLPGGYISDKGPDQGTAILTRKAPFKAFVISDTIAVLLSISAVFLHLSLAVPRNDKKFFLYFATASLLTRFSMAAMMVAFMTGLYSALEHSSGLGIATCVIACCFFFLYYSLFAKPFGGKMGGMLMYGFKKGEGGSENNLAQFISSGMQEGLVR